jgi:hypothetical protein
LSFGPAKRNPVLVGFSLILVDIPAKFFFSIGGGANIEFAFVDEKVRWIAFRQNAFAPALKTGLQWHAQLESEDPHVGGAVVAAGIDNVLKIWLNVCPMKDIERVENFLDKLVRLYAETGTGMAGAECSLGILYVAGDAVVTRCYTAGIVWSLAPRAPVVESSERLKILKCGPWI